MARDFYVSDLSLILYIYLLFDSSRAGIVKNWADWALSNSCEVHTKKKKGFRNINIFEDLCLIASG